MSDKGNNSSWTLDLAALAFAPRRLGRAAGAAPEGAALPPAAVTVPAALLAVFTALIAPSFAAAAVPSAAASTATAMIRRVRVRANRRRAVPAFLVIWR